MLTTISVNDIVNNLEIPIFDFDYTFNETTILDTTYNKEYLENFFIMYWGYYQIGYSTVEEFKWRLKRSWLSKIQQFKQRLLLYPKELDLTSEKRYKTSEIKNDNRYSDTPNEEILSQDLESGYLTDRTLNDMSATQNETITNNELEKYMKIEKGVTDIVSSFIASFRDLFITDIIINSGGF